GPPAARVGDRAPRVPELARAREARAQVPPEPARRALRAAARRTVAAAPPLLCRRSRGPSAPQDRPNGRRDRPGIAVAHSAHDSSVPVDPPPGRGLCPLSSPGGEATQDEPKRLGVDVPAFLPTPRRWFGDNGSARRPTRTGTA